MHQKQQHILNILDLTLAGT